MQEPAAADPSDLDGDGVPDAVEEAFEGAVDDAEAMARATHQAVDLDEHGIPRPLRWHLVWSWKGMALGVVADLAIEGILHRFGYLILDVPTLVLGMALGAAIGATAPSLGRLVGVVWANRRIRQAHLLLEGA